MSDLPPPPPPGGGPVPPPPPDIFAAAPAAVDPYASAARLRRVGGIATAATVLIGVAAVFSIIQYVAYRAVSDDAERYLANELTDREFEDAIIGPGAAVLGGLVAVIAAGVLTMIWMYRLAANHRALHRDVTWGPLWGIFGWVLPPFLYIIPFLMLRELWRTSDPDAATGDRKQGSVTPAITAWFVLSIVFGVLSFAGGSTDVTASSNQAFAEAITESGGQQLALAAVSVAGAAAFIVVIRRLTARHRRLTGEG